MAEEMQFSPVRVTASTQEAAIEQALAMTGATREQIAFEVLEESGKGITLRVRPRLEGESSGAQNPDAEYSGAAQATAERPVEEEELDADEDGLDDEDVEDEAFARQETDDDEEGEEFEGESESISYDEDDIEADIDDEDLDAVEADALMIEDEDDELQPGFDEEVVAAAQERVQTLATEILQRMDLDVEAGAVPLPQWMIDPDATFDVPRVFLQIEGEDVSILIGKRGNTLQSFQYLLNLTLNNRVDEAETEGGVHVVVDAGDYRARRASALQQSARDAAERAKRERRAIRMEPLGGHERRLVHLALRGDSEVSTSSEGREPWRRVIVTPANARGGSSDGSRSANGRSDSGYAERGGSGRGGSGHGGSGNDRGGRGGYGSYDRSSGGGSYGNSGGGSGGRRGEGSERGEGRRYGSGRR